MRIYETGLSHVFGLHPKGRSAMKLLAILIVLSSLFTPITFGFAFMDYVKRDTSQIMKWEFNPIFKTITRYSEPNSGRTNQIVKTTK